jgi:hypothetical protein
VRSSLELAENMYVNGLQVAEETHGRYSLERGSALAELACLYLEMGKFDDCNVVARQAYQIRVRMLGTQSAKVKELLPLIKLAEDCM